MFRIRQIDDDTLPGNRADIARVQEILRSRLPGIPAKEVDNLPKQTKVADVIAKALTAFGFAPGDKFELVLASNPGEALQPERPLVSYHVADGMVLVLTAIGGGV